MPTSRVATSRSTMSTAPAWAEFWRQVTLLVSQAHPTTFVRWEFDVAFHPQSREDMVEKGMPHGFTSLPSGYPDVALDYFSAQLAATLEDLGPGAVVVGIVKKGLSILFEVDKRVNLRERYQLIWDSEIQEAQITGRSVLLVDDCVHEGDTLRKLLGKVCEMQPKKVAVATFLAHEPGIAAVREAFPNVEISRMMRIHRDELFSFYFMKYETPLLDYCRMGANGHRKGLPLKLHHPTLNRLDSAVEVLSALCRLPGVDKVQEMPPLHSMERSPVFKATISLREELSERISKEYPRTSDFIKQQDKVRVHLSVRDGIDLHLCGMRYFGVSYPSEAPLEEVIGELESLETIVGAELQNHFHSSLRQLLTPRGFIISGS